MKNMGSVVAIGGLVGAAAYVGVQVQTAPPLVLGALMALVVLAVYVAGQMK